MKALIFLSLFISTFVYAGKYTSSGEFSFNHVNWLNSDKEGIANLRFDVSWKAWPLAQEPVIDSVARWYPTFVGFDIRIKDPKTHELKTYSSTLFPQKIINNVIYDLKIRAMVNSDPYTWIIMDQGVISKAGETSMNIPRSPNWDEYFVDNQWKNTVTKEEAKAIFKDKFTLSNGAVHSMECNLHEVKDYLLTTFVNQEKQKTYQAVISKNQKWLEAEIGKLPTTPTLTQLKDYIKELDNSQVSPQHEVKKQVLLGTLRQELRKLEVEVLPYKEEIKQEKESYQAKIAEKDQWYKTSEKLSNQPEISAYNQLSALFQDAGPYQLYATMTFGLNHMGNYKPSISASEQDKCLVKFIIDNYLPNHEWNTIECNLRNTICTHSTNSSLIMLHYDPIATFYQSNSDLLFNLNKVDNDKYDFQSFKSFLVQIKPYTEALLNSCRE